MTSHKVGMRVDGHDVFGADYSDQSASNRKKIEIALLVVHLHCKAFRAICTPDEIHT
jgi:hypothetical protein